MRKCISRLLFGLAIVLLFFKPTLGDAPGEWILVSYQNISRDVLKDAIGIITVTAGLKKAGKEFRTYKKEGQDFKPDKTLAVAEGTSPVSYFGYSREIGPLPISNFRYPVTETISGYLRVVYEPTEDLRAWISQSDLETEFYFRTLFFDNFPKETMVDVFLFTSDSTRKVYAEPKPGASSTVISAKEFRKTLIVVGQSEGFLQVAPLGKSEFDVVPLSERTEKPIGWIEIRDTKGLLSIWIYHADSC